MPPFPANRLSARSAYRREHCRGFSLLLAGCANEGDSGPETVTVRSTIQATEDTDAQAHDPDASVVATTGKPGDKVALAPLTKALVTPSAVAQVHQTAQAAGGDIPGSGYSNPGMPEVLRRDVRAAEHEGFDRLVFEFSGNPEVVEKAMTYQDAPDQQGTGDIEPVKGNAYLPVLLRRVAVADTPEGRQFVGRGSLGVAAGNILDVFNSGGTEGDSLFYVGLDSERDFTFQMLENPPRIVLDFPK